MWSRNFLLSFILYLSVNANGIIGSLDDNHHQQEECTACTKGKCRSINGIYTKPDLPTGYSLVAQIPQGACRILIQQLKHTRNYLALRNANSSFIINGDGKVANSGISEGAGARFTYVKQESNSLETISSPGPLANPVDIMIVNYQPNMGVKYGYSLPMYSTPPLIAPPLIKRPPEGVPEPRRLETPLNQRDEARPVISHHRRTRLRRRFAWKISGVSACSKSCGGGVQATVVTCVREHTQTPVSEKRCIHLEKPSTQPIRCNAKDCPAQWETHWGSCSVSCGDGVQHQVPQCRRELASGRIVPVSEAVCPEPRPPALARPCDNTPCEGDNELTGGGEVGEDWTVGSWSTCSTSCGSGHRTRTVTCPSSRCRPEDRPSHASPCHSAPCHTSSNTPSLWLVTDWSPCSELCGTGTQTRLTICPHTSDCSTPSKPETERACSSERQCGGRWLAGEWSTCPASCASTSQQRRPVVCAVRVRGQWRITNDGTCQHDARPDEERACPRQGEACPQIQWYAGEWGHCEGCGGGGEAVQRREVRCLDEEGREREGCRGDVPAGRRPCACERNGGERYKPAQDEPIDRSCVDRIRNCYLAVQARLCQYPYYTNHCCVSCKRAQQDLLE